MQLVQFLIILGQNIAALYYGNDCGFAQVSTQAIRSRM